MLPEAHLQVVQLQQQERGAARDGLPAGLRLSGRWRGRWPPPARQEGPAGPGHDLLDAPWLLRHHLLFPGSHHRLLQEEGQAATDWGEGAGVALLLTI